MKLPLFRQARETAEMIKISHSVFALPFALGAGALAMRTFHGGVWSWGTAGWIIFCAVTARTAAMAQNRLLDAHLDAGNPRTASRALPAGRVSRLFVLGIVLLASGAFVFGAYRLNELVFLLSPVALIVLLGYPLAKRFTTLCHLWLGLALALAPVGAWLAVGGEFRAMGTPLLMGGAVLLWTAGFDLIYSCQDYDHDKQAGLHSIPARIGIPGALMLARLFHLVAVLLLAGLFFVNPDVGVLYGVGLAAAAGLLVYEHSLVGPTDLSRLDLAFFTLNGLVSLVLGAATVADSFL